MPSITSTPVPSAPAPSTEAEKNENSILLKKGNLYTIFLFPLKEGEEERLRAIQLFRQAAQGLSKNFYWKRTTWEMLEKNNASPALLVLSDPQNNIFYFFFRQISDVDSTGPKSILEGVANTKDVVNTVEDFYEHLYHSPLDLDFE